MRDHPNKKVRVMTKLKFICWKGGHNALPPGRLGVLSEHDTTGAHKRIKKTYIEFRYGYNDVPSSYLGGIYSFSFNPGCCQPPIRTAVHHRYGRGWGAPVILCYCLQDSQVR
jgi:hypothetical protein